jgi:hypothetical protein
MRSLSPPSTSHPSRVKTILERIITYSQTKGGYRANIHPIKMLCFKYIILELIPMSTYRLSYVPSYKSYYTVILWIIYI